MRAGKAALLFVSFGRPFGELQREARARFPGASIRCACLHAPAGEEDAEKALSRLAAEGFGAVLCQPVLLGRGREYESFLRRVLPFSGRFARFAAGVPLLACDAHGRDLAAVLHRSFSAPDEGGAAVFVGHGGEPVSLLARGFASLGMERWHVGAIAGDPAPEALAARLRGAGAARAVLAPLLLRDGLHASRDVFGLPPSWQSSLEAAGLAVTPHRGGLADLDGVRALFLRRAEEGFAALPPC